MEIVSLKGGAVYTNGNMQIQSERSMAEVETSDLVLIPPHICGVDPNRNTQTPYMITTFRKSHGNREVLRIQEWMEKHYMEEFTTDKVADLAGLSSRHFKRRIKRATGENPLRYLQQLRLETAKNRLETTSDNIDEITLQVGDNDARTFRRLFKPYTSLYPREYRGKFSVV